MARTWGVRPPLPPGGRDRVLRKEARHIAGQMAPHVTATDDELAAIEVALCTMDFSPHTLHVSRRGGLVRGMPRKLPRKVQATLRAFMKRNHAAVQEQHRAHRAAQGQAGIEVVGELPEPFSRSGRAKGATSRDDDMSWLGLPDPPPKPRVNLPLPTEKELVDLPVPTRKPKR